MVSKINLSIMSIFVAAALIGSIVAVSSTIDNQAFAGGDHHDKKKKKSNDAVQIIEQSALTSQDSSCGSKLKTIASCNNLAFTANLNDGNNALAQE